MTILPIVLHPDPVLRQISKPVTDITDDIISLAENMLQTMINAPGIGLAAPQVGILQRIIVADINGRDGQLGQPFVLINPEIIASSDEKSELEEGCLSLPDLTCIVKRPVEVTVKYVDLKGSEQQITADGLLAKVFQHEIDHLNGKLIFDHLSALKRGMAERRYLKQLKHK